MMRRLRWLAVLPLRALRWLAFGWAERAVARHLAAAERYPLLSDYDDPPEATRPGCAIYHDPNGEPNPDMPRRAGR
jgi:hypothetical protein